MIFITSSEIFQLGINVDAFLLEQVLRDRSY